MASNCTRGGLDYILGKIVSRKAFSSIGTSHPGKRLSHSPWRYLKDAWMWHLGAWFSGGLCSFRLTLDLIILIFDDLQKSPPPALPCSQEKAMAKQWFLESCEGPSTVCCRIPSETSMMNSFACNSAINMT